MISTYQRLKDNLEYLKLKKASESLDEVIDFITANELSFTEGLLRLTDVEMDHRKANLIKSMVKVGAFPFIKEVKDFDSIVDVNDNSFLAPASMIEAIKDYCRKTGQKVPETPGEIALCVYDSLAVCYKRAVETVERVTGYKFDTIHIVGGGCQNAYLNELTAKRTGRRVVAGPVEATAIGNALSQLLYDGAVKNINEAKELVKVSFDTETIG